MVRGIWFMSHFFCTLHESENKRTCKNCVALVWKHTDMRELHAFCIWYLGPLPRAHSVKIFLGLDCVSLQELVKVIWSIFFTKQSAGKTLEALWRVTWPHVGSGVMRYLWPLAKLGCGPNAIAREQCKGALRSTHTACKRCTWYRKMY